MFTFKTTRFQFFIIDNQTGILHMQDLHDVPPSVDENKHTSAANILVHGGGHNTAQVKSHCAYLPAWDKDSSSGIGAGGT
jgi:hypothetical protein